MGSRGSDPAFLHDGDPVRHFDGGRAMGDDDGGPALPQGAERGTYPLLGDGVEGRRRLVEDENGGVLEECARKRDTLPLPPREVQAVLSDRRIQPLGKLVEEVGDVSRLGRPVNRLTGCGS